MTSNEEVLSILPPENWWETPISPEFKRWMRRKLCEQELQRLKEAYYSNPLPNRHLEIHGEKYFELLNQSYLCLTPAARLLELCIQEGILKRPG